MDTQISMKEFVDKYKETDNKIKYVQSVIKTDVYIPYFEKLVYLDNIINIANYDKHGNIYCNTPKQDALFNMTVLQLYTNIDTTIDTFVEDYSILMGVPNLIDQIIDYMPNDYHSYKELYIKKRIDFENNINLINVNDIANAVNNGIVKGIDQVLNAIESAMPEISNFINQITNASE